MTFVFLYSHVDLFPSFSHTVKIVFLHFVDINIDYVLTEIRYSAPFIIVGKKKVENGLGDLTTVEDMAIIQ